MIFKRIWLEGEDKTAYLDVYVADPLPQFVRKAILVIPGGGYGAVCSDREGEPIGMAFMPYGFNAFVLHYSVAENSTAVFPRQLIQASKAMKHIKDHAEEYNIDPEKVYATGFSAGGHLCGSLGILWHLQAIYDEVDMPYGYNKPAGIILNYPVITATAPTHQGSFCKLFGTEEPSDEQIRQGSLENHVDEKSAPAFIVHTANDGVVPVRNALVLAEAYARAGRKFELHVYPNGPHGMSLSHPITAHGNEILTDPAYRKWVEQAAVWADRDDK